MFLVSRFSILDRHFGFLSHLYTTYSVSRVPNVVGVSRFSILDRHFGFLSRLYTTYSVSRVPNVAGV